MINRYLDNADRVVKWLTSENPGKEFDREFVNEALSYLLGFKDFDREVQLVFERLSFEQMKELLQDWQQVFDVVQLDEAIELVDDQYLTEERIDNNLSDKRVHKYSKIDIHAYDADDHYVHGHFSSTIKIDLATGEIYNKTKKNIIMTINRKKLIRIRSQIKHIDLPEISI
jgi:hypothetical protein